jgi:hypothetical protein
MDKSNELQPSSKERDEGRDGHTGTSIILTATLAIAGIGSPTLLQASTPEGRIMAIQKAIKSGAIELQPISSPGKAPLKGRMMAHDKGEGPEPPGPSGP